MNEAKELRLGVCECLPAFKEKFNDRQIEVPPGSFRVVQVPIGEDHYPELYVTRSHFFIDYVESEGGFIMSSINLFPSKDGRREQVHPARNGGQRVWWRGFTPSVDEVLEAASGMLRALGPSKLESWLDHMTPAGWTMPSRSLALAASCDMPGSRQQPLAR